MTGTIQLSCRIKSFVHRAGWVCPRWWRATPCKRKNIASAQSQPQNAGRKRAAPETTQKLFDKIRPYRCCREQIRAIQQGTEQDIALYCKSPMGDDHQGSWVPRGSAEDQMASRTSFFFDTLLQITLQTRATCRSVSYYLRQFFQKIVV